MKVVRGVESLIHELLDVLLVNPGSAQAHLDLRSVQVFGLGGGQGLHIDGKGRVLLCGSLCLTELAPHIAGQVFVGCYIMGSAVFLQLPRYTEDHALQLGGQFVAGLAGQLRHIRHIDTGFFGN